MKRFAAVAPLLAPFALACSGPLATLPPSDTFTIVQTPAPKLNDEERRLVDDLNKELDRLGLPAAQVGGYECNVAAVMANVALAKIWHGSGRYFAVNSDIVAPSKPSQDSTQSGHKAGGPHVVSLTDEENDTELKHVHEFQHEVSYGISPIYAHLFTTPYAQKHIEHDDIQKWVQQMRNGGDANLTLGVAVLPAGDSDQRIWVTVFNDHSFDLAKGPPRTAAPSSSFEVSGRVFDKKIAAMKAGLLGPDGKVQLTLLSLDADGQFDSTFALPATPGIYTFELKSTFGDRARFWVPIFVGVDPSPWPPSADPKATPITGTRSLATKLVQTIADYRRAHQLPPVSFDVDISAYAKSEATAYAKLVDEATGPGAGTAIQDFRDGQQERLAAAGMSNVQGWTSVWSDDYINDYFARFPNNVFLAADLASPTLQAIGIGVALVPTTVSKNDDRNLYSFGIFTKDPARPELQAPKPPEPVAAPQTPTLAPQGP